MLELIILSKIKLVNSLNFIRFFPLPRRGAGEKRLNSERYNVVR